MPKQFPLCIVIPLLRVRIHSTFGSKAMVTQRETTTVDHLLYLQELSVFRVFSLPASIETACGKQCHISQRSHPRLISGQYRIYNRPPLFETPQRACFCLKKEFVADSEYTHDGDAERASNSWIT